MYKRDLSYWCDNLKNYDPHYMRGICSLTKLITPRENCMTCYRRRYTFKELPVGSCCFHVVIKQFFLKVSDDSYFSFDTKTLYKVSVSDNDLYIYQLAELEYW